MPTVPIRKNNTGYNYYILAIRYTVFRGYFLHAKLSVHLGLFYTWGKPSYYHTKEYTGYTYIMATARIEPHVMFFGPPNEIHSIEWG